MGAVASSASGTGRVGETLGGVRWDIVVQGPWGPQAELPGWLGVLSAPPPPRGILSLGVWVGEDCPSGSRRLPCFTKPPLQSPSLCDSACCPRRA